MIPLMSYWFRVGLVAAVVASTGTHAAVDEFRFNVLLDEKPIGSHSFRLKQEDAGLRVQTEAAFDVQVLFVPVFSYRHSNTEVWRGGCLHQIRSQTDSNGDRYQVLGQTVGDGFLVNTESETQTYTADCVMSFAYWDRNILSQNRLLNAQTGELIDVDVEPLGVRQITLDERQVSADGYRIVSTAEQVDIRVYYRRSDGRWLSLESKLGNGRIMRYLPAAGDRQVAARGPSEASMGGK